MKERNVPMIYNVLVGGVSIGMTFNIAEAQDWKRHSSHSDAKVMAVPYLADRSKYRDWKPE